MAERHRVRRRRWSEEEKRQIVAQTLIPGMSVSQVARRYDVNTNLVFTWRRNPRLRPAEAQELDSTFVPVEVVSGPVPTGADAIVEIALRNGHRVSVRGPLDVEALCRLVHGLAR
ncbi:MAG: transposase [Gemmatimonadetes bacterium]|nr:transposase [Gemmatimonadota bacterium]